MKAEESGTFEFGEGGIHRVGDVACPGCWPGYPVQCDQNGCNGLVHAHFGDEDADCNYWLYRRCENEEAGCCER